METPKKKKSPHPLVPLARQMRKDGTLAEVIAWKLLKDRRMFGYKFRRQVPIDNYIVDFYCHELKLIIELDGEIHAEDQQFEHDQKRDARLQQLGYKVARFPNEFLLENADFFDEAIRALLPPSPGPSPGPDRPTSPEGEVRRGR